MKLRGLGFLFVCFLVSHLLNIIITVLICILRTFTITLKFKFKITFKSEGRRYIFKNSSTVFRPGGHYARWTRSN